MFTPIQKILPKAAAALGVKREIEAAVVCEKYRRLAPKLLHPEILSHTTPKFYKGRTLTIAVENPAWAERVILRKEDLIKEMNGALGKKYIEKLKTQVVERLTAQDVEEAGV